jgi:MFS superfamily sulfate permease-like transporter
MQGNWVPEAAQPDKAARQAARWADAGAGLCVAGLLLPEAVAYAGLAHLPVANALTASMLGLAIYALFGGSRFAIVAPTSSSATLCAAAVVSVTAGAGAAGAGGVAGASTDSSAYLQAFSALVLLAGGLLALLAWARQGQLSAFVSRPVLRAFAFALAITIVIKQLPDALGLVLPSSMSHDPFHVLAYAIEHLRDWHGPSVLLALGAGALLLFLSHFPKWPASMGMMVLSIAAARLLDLKAMGIEEVGAIAPPRFDFAVPDLPWADWLRLGELAFGLVVLLFAESWGSVRAMALAHPDPAKDRPLDANRELLVLGACNAASALLHGMAVGAGFSASSANAAAGATSKWAGGVALLVMAAALLLALPALHLLPRPVLAVAVISALWHALSPGPLLAVWRMNRDRLLVVGSVAAVLVLGVLHGMLAAIALSLVAALRRFSLPVVHTLGQLGATRNYVTLEGHEGQEGQNRVLAVPGVLILRPEEPLFFASSERVVRQVVQMAGPRPGHEADPSDIRTVVLSLEESSDLDSTAAECLLELSAILKTRGQQLVLARVKDGVRQLLVQLDPQGLGNPQRLFWSVADAAESSRPAIS